MTITEVKVKTISGDKCLGVASVTIDDAICIRDIKIISGPKGLFIAMPSKVANEKRVDLAFPINAAAREQLTEAILAKYNKEVAAVK